MDARGTDPERATLLPAPAPAGADFLRGGGEMGALMRGHDWAATPLGPARLWPQSLRTALGILLDNHYPMYIAWGGAYVQFYNDAYRPILGSKHPDALGRGTAESFVEIWDFVRPIFERVMVEGEPTYLEDQLLPLDRHGYAEECYFTYCDSAIRDESGGVGGVLVTIIETTERVLGERRLRTLRDLGAAAVEAQTPDAAWTTVTQILERNAFDLPFFVLYRVDEPGVARRVGLAGLPADHPAAPDAVLLAADDDPAIAWPLAAAAVGGAAVVVEDATARFGTLDCGPWPEKPRSALVLPIIPPRQDRAAGVLVAGVSGRRPLDASYRDFLEQVAAHVATALANARAHEEERQRAHSLAELDRAKTIFFSDVSHEFRTPLTLILDPLERLADAPELDEAQRETLRLVRRNATRLLKLVNTLLDFSRIEAGRADASFEPTDLAETTTELASAFQSAMDHAGLQFVVDCPSLAAPVHVDREMWEKIVANLVSNALKFTLAGRVVVALRADDERAVLTVRDTGVGIPAAELPRVFERFHRVRGTRARTHEGTGIGLALVRDLVALHGGTVAVESTEGVGTTFTVAIPFGVAHLPPERVGARHALESTALGAAPFVEEALRWSGDAARAPETPAADPIAAQGLRLPKSVRDPVPAGAARPRILLVDDNADMRGYLHRLLSSHWDVDAQADGHAALAAARRHRPDLVLTDVMMPGMDGFELLRTLREHPVMQGVPIVLLSARAGEEATVDALQAGADDYLVKPFSARELRARVAAQLALAGMRRRLTTLEERNRLALELHDSVSQTLIAVDLLAARLPERLERNAASLHPELERLGQMTRGAMAEMRLLLTEMRPETLASADPATLVRQALDVARARAAFEATLTVEGDDDGRELPPEVRLALLRIAQESLGNAMRHARAARVDVRLRLATRSATLHVSDDGIGFDPALRRGGIGLGGMAERAQRVGGALDVASRPGAGTRVTFVWPALQT